MMDTEPAVKMWGLAIGGAVLGAIVGSILFKLVLSQGFYALAVPGAFAGWGAGYFLPRRNKAVGLAAGSIALVVSILCEWYTAPFNADGSLLYFVTHLHQLRIMTWIMIAIGTVLGFSLGCGRK